MKGCIYVIFIDYTKAFDYFDQEILIRKLETVTGATDPTLHIWKNILKYNYIELDDGYHSHEK
jgi:hypothetical protein